MKIGQIYKRPHDNKLFEVVWIYSMSGGIGQVDFKVVGETGTFVREVYVIPWDAPQEYDLVTDV